MNTRQKPYIVTETRNQKAQKPETRKLDVTPIVKKTDKTNAKSPGNGSIVYGSAAWICRDEKHAVPVSRPVVDSIVADIKHTRRQLFFIIDQTCCAVGRLAAAQVILVGEEERRKEGGGEDIDGLFISWMSIVGQEGVERSWPRRVERGWPRGADCGRSRRVERSWPRGAERSWPMGEVTVVGQGKLSEVGK